MCGLDSPTGLSGKERVGLSTLGNLLQRVKAVWVPRVFRAIPSVPPQGPQTGIFVFAQKCTRANSVDMATTQKLLICFSC